MLIIEPGTPARWLHGDQAQLGQDGPPGAEVQGVPPLLNVTGPGDLRQRAPESAGSQSGGEPVVPVESAAYWIVQGHVAEGPQSGCHAVHRLGAFGLWGMRLLGVIRRWRADHDCGLDKMLLRTRVGRPAQAEQAQRTGRCRLPDPAPAAHHADDRNAAKRPARWGAGETFRA
jgi:hypothetical protein